MDELCLTDFENTLNLINSIKTHPELWFDGNNTNTNNIWEEIARNHNKSGIFNIIKIQKHIY